MEQWGQMTEPTQPVSSGTGTAADKIVQQAKAQAAQEELEKVRLGDLEQKMSYISNTWAYCNPVRPGI